MNQNNTIHNSLTVNENKYPFLKTLRNFLKKIPTFEACYLSGAVVQDEPIDFAIDPILYIYIIVNREVTPYIYTFTRTKATDIIKDYFFPNYTHTEVFFIQTTTEETKFKLKCCSVFWFGNRDYHNKLPSYCLCDINRCCKNESCCAHFLRTILNRATNGETLWLNNNIMLKNIINAIYEKNSKYLESFHHTYLKKTHFITNHPQISKIDKKIVTQTFNMMKDEYTGRNIAINTPFITFVANYLDFHNKKKTALDILNGEDSIYTDWLYLDKKKHIKENGEEEDRSDFDFLFDKKNKPLLGREHRNQVPSHTNAAGLTKDQMKRLRRNKS